MALFRRSPVGRAITAAGRRIDPTDQAVIAAARQPPQKWQDRAYGYRDLLGEIRFMSNYYAVAMSRMRLVPAVIGPGPDRDPLPLDDESIDPPLGDDERQAAQMAADRLGGSPLGQAELLQLAGENMVIGGEVYVVGRENDDGREVWNAVAGNALDVAPSGKALTLLEMPNQPKDKAASLDEAIVFRTWRKHPQWPAWPDSAMRSAIEYCEDLRILTQMIRAAATSRMPSSVFGVPLEASFPKPQLSGDPGDSGDGQGNQAESSTGDPLTDDIINHFSKAVENPGDAAALVPFVLRLPRNELEGIQKWEFHREIDRLAVQLRQETRESLAGSIDLPVDVLTGKQGLNDWSAFNVDEETFRMHFEPLISLLCAGFTEGYYVPMLAEMGVEDPSRFMLWYDPSALISHPDQGKTYTEGWDRRLVSNAAWRKANNVPEADAPDDAEVAARTPAETEPEEEPADDEGDHMPPEPRGPDSGAPAAASRNGHNGNGNGSKVLPEIQAIIRDEVERQLYQERLVAAARPINLGLRLADLEASATTQIREMVDGQLRRALERAGNRLRSLAGRSPEAKAAVAGAEPLEVGGRLGEAMVAALDTSAVDLFAGAFDDLEIRFKSALRRRHEEALALISGRARGMTAAISQTELADWRRRQEDDRDEAWALLVAALGVAAATRLFTPETEPPARGEFAGTLFPAGDLRAVLTAAGGGPVVDRTSAGALVERPAGPLSGATVTDLFDRAVGLTLGGGYVWIYGDPGARLVPFDPHLDLDGREFATWDSPELANDQDWPEEEFYFPGDHANCQCSFARVVLAESEGAGSEELEDVG